MRANQAAGVVVLGVCLALIGGIIYALHLIGSTKLAELATFGTIGALVIGTIAAMSLPIKAWRSNQQPERERHYHTKETKIVHREPQQVSAPQGLPALPEPNMALFPAMIGAAFRQGLLRSGDAESEIEVVDSEAQEVPPERPKVWH